MNEDMQPAKMAPGAKSRIEAIVTWFAWICVALGMTAAVVGLYVAKQDASGFSLQNLGNFGSYAQGTVASLWSLGALFFLYATLLAQRRQITQQEAQLEQQHGQFEAEQRQQQEANRRQDEQFRLQQQSIQIQNFENSFFQMFKLLSEVRQQTTIHCEPPANGGAYEGPACFKFCKNQLTSRYANSRLQDVSNVVSPDLSELEAAAQEYFMQFYGHFQDDLDQYFRVIYHVIKFVDASDALSSDVERRRYTSLVRAQLSANELFLIFYNGVCPHAKKFRPLIEKYGLLEHLDRSLILHESHLRFYDEAYK